MTSIGAVRTITNSTGMITRNNVKGCIADMISPKVMSTTKSGKYHKADNSHFRLEDDEATDRGGVNEVSGDYTEAEYYIKGYGYKEFLGQSVMDEADQTIKANLKNNIIQGLKDRLMLKSEKRMADLLFSATTFSGHTSALSGADMWDNASSTILDQWKTASLAVDLDGKNPVNAVILGKKTYLKGIAYNEQLLDLINGFGSKYAIVTPEVLKALLEAQGHPIQQVLIGGAVYDSADEGATESGAYIWGTGALFAHVDLSQNTVINTNTVVKTFVQKNKPWEYKFAKDPRPDVEGIWGIGRVNYQHLAIDSNLGYYFSNCVNA